MFVHKDSTIAYCCPFTFLYIDNKSCSGFRKCNKGHDQFTLNFIPLELRRPESETPVTTWGHLGSPVLTDLIV